MTVTRQEHDALAHMLIICAAPPKFMVSSQCQGRTIIRHHRYTSAANANSDPDHEVVQFLPTVQAAGERRIQVSEGSPQAFRMVVPPVLR